MGLTKELQDLIDKAEECLRLAKKEIKNKEYNIAQMHLNCYKIRREGFLDYQDGYKAFNFIIPLERKNNSLKIQIKGVQHD